MSELPVTLRAGCKVNLFLDITAVRPDGRHELHSLFWPLAEPHDELLVRPGTDGIRLRCAAPEVDPAHNTVVSAWTRFAAATGFAPALDVELIKTIPSGAGLGGGSADAAALLLWLNSGAPVPLSSERLVRVAESVGADVPFFLHNRPALGLGVGEILRPCPNAACYNGLYIVLVCHPLAVSTAEAFRAFDAALHENAHFLPRSTLCALTTWPLTGKNTDFKAGEALYAHADRHPYGGYVRNSLEAVVFARHSELKRLKVSLFRHGATAAGMSGSGSALFGLFRNAHTARQAEKAMTVRGARCWTQQLTLF